jgi:alpha-L-fucosidase
MVTINRRALLGAPLYAALGASATAQLPISRGPFQPTADSLKTYQAPDWFRDAKFGIWAHWGPQAVPRSGDWYARWMYVPGHPHYAHHLKHYGHPSESGYKDIIPLWTGKNWEPETLIRKYKKAGAKYFVSLGVHCDNFDCWRTVRLNPACCALRPARMPLTASVVTMVVLSSLTGVSP